MSFVFRCASIPIKRSVAIARLSQAQRLCSNESGETASEVPKKGYRKVIVFSLVGFTGLAGGLVAYCLYNKKFVNQLEHATGLNLDFLHSSQRSAEAYLPFLGPSTGSASEKLSPVFPALPAPLVKEHTTLESAAPKTFAEEKPAQKQKPEPISKASKPGSSSSNAELLAKLSASQKSVEAAIENAVTKGIAAETKIKQYSQQFKHALATKAEADLAQVKAAEAAKAEALKAARDAHKKTEQLLSQWKAALDDPKVQNTPAAKSGLATYKSFLYELDSIKANTERAESEVCILSEYKAEADKQQPQQQQQLLRSEVENLLPADKRGTDADLSREDLQLLIAHAHSKILELQKQVEEFEDRERRLVQQVVDKSAAAGVAQTEAAVERELKHQMLHWEEEKRNLTQQLRESWELELQQQLSRQAAAHTSHVTQLTRTLREQLGREHQAELRARLLKEHEEFEAALQGWTARVRGIESAVEGRAAMLEAAQRAQQLWLAAHSLRAAVATGRDFHAPLEAVTSLAAALGRDDSAVRSLTSALPHKCVVSSEEALTARFARVKRACSRVALVPETGGSLWLHLLSRLQASLMLRRATKPLRPEEPVDPTDPPSLYDWLDTAEAALAERGDLETAVRAMARLPGMARLLADDWIREARAHLEAKQTAAALCALAAAMGLDAATQHRLPALADPK